jgi:hypothetical protein
MVNKPVIDRSGPIRPKVMANGFDRLEGKENVQFLAKDGVLGAA